MEEPEAEIHEEVSFSGRVPRFGTDESGKGDFFGSLVTVGFYIKDKIIEKRLEEIGETK